MVQNFLPTWYVVYDAIRREQGGLTDRQLYEMLIEKNPWISVPQLSEMLLKLEAAGKIRTVKGAKKDTLLIELTEEKKHRYLLTDED